jgi:hypothetical protein
MGYQRPDFDDEWQGLEPEQPSETRWALWLGAGGIILLLLGLGIVGGYVLVRQFQNRTEFPTPLFLPTSPVATPSLISATLAPEPPTAPTATLGEPQPVATDLPLAATSTPLPPEPTPAPPIGTGPISAHLLPAAPLIDGILSEWNGLEEYQSDHRVFSATDWDGTDDLTATWRLAWDANNLYIAVQVIDDAHVQTQTGNQIFRGDSVDMQFDTDRAGDFGDGVSPDDIQITLSPGDFAALAPSAFRFQGSNDGRILDAPGGNNINVAAMPTALGYNLEAAIPWSDLSVSPAAGLVMGLALNASDNDRPGTATQEVMVSHVAGRTLLNPTTWGTLTLNP